jgi:hypothetical protein
MPGGEQKHQTWTNKGNDKNIRTTKSLEKKKNKKKKVTQ